MRTYLRKFLYIEQYWFGEWRIHLFNRHTNLCWMDPREWRQGWWFSYEKSFHSPNQTMRRIRVIGFDYHWSTFQKDT